MIYDLPMYIEVQYSRTYLSKYFAYNNHILTVPDNSTLSSIILAILIYFTDSNATDTLMYDHFNRASRA
jgi:hypothetical protein